MTDIDGDGYGGIAPAFGATPGNDCDDRRSDLSWCCLQRVTVHLYDRSRWDGYGDVNPATGVSPGTDCDDTDPLLETSDDDLDGYSTCTGDCDDEDSSLNLLDNDNDGYSLVQAIVMTKPKCHRI